MNEIQNLIQKTYAEHMDSFHKVISLMEQLPNHEKDCDCDENITQHIDIDVDWGASTVSTACMRCGGYVTHE